ncbi:MAG TPA: alpha/beta hydrolase [Mucilaginibacter sp.]|jgi:acetyl esterase/lipase
MKKILTMVSFIMAISMGMAQEKRAIVPPLKASEPFPESTLSSKRMMVLDAGPARTEQINYAHDVKYATHSGMDLHLQIIAPSAINGATLPCIIFIPGSAWMKQNVYNSVFRMAKFTEKGYVVVLVEYRPSSVAPFPAQVQDAKTAVRYMRKNAAKYKIDEKNIFVWGDSSGGHTALFVGLTQDMPDLDMPDYNEFSAGVNATVDYYGPTDISQMAYRPSTMDHTLPDSPEGLLIGKKNVLESPAEAGKANPIAYIKNGKKVAPILIMHGSKDRLVPFEQSVLLADALDSHHYTYEFYKLPGADHGSFEFWTEKTFDTVDAFLKENMAK